MYKHACHRVPPKAHLAEIRHFRDFSVTAEAVTDLRHAADVLRRQNDDYCHRVADALQRYVDRDVDSLDEAFGVRHQRGQRTRSTVAAHVERDRLVVEAVAAHYANKSREHAAELLAADLERYAASGWQRGECDLDEFPSRLGGKIYKFCWLILKAKNLPIGAPRIKQILADNDNEIPSIHYRDGGRCSSDNTEKC